MTVDEMEQRDLTYLEQTYGAQAERDTAAHASAVKAQGQARQAANREAYIGSELMQKYLPQYQAMQGTAGMGTSQTDAAVAYNAYLGRVSDNNASYARNVAALDQQKAETDAQREAEKREREFAIRDVYEGERQMMAQDESDGLLSLMAGRAEGYYGTDGKISSEDYEDLAAFYAANEARLTEAGKRNAQDLLGEYKLAIRDAEEQAAIDRRGYVEKGITVAKNPVSYEPGRNLTVKDGSGSTYSVKLGEAVADQDVMSQADKADSGEVFAYGGKLYLKQDQTVYAVERRNGQKGDYTSLYDLYMGRSGADEKQETAEVDTPKHDVTANVQKTRKGRG